MRTYNGKLLTVYISPTGVRVAEGENRGGNPTISRFFTVPAVEEYFTEVPGQTGTYEITNMSGLIDVILNECQNQRTSSRRVMISTNCLGIQTEITTEQGRSSIKDMLTADIGGSKKDKNPNKKKGSLGNLTCVVSWGELIKDGRACRQVSTTSGDKFICTSLAQEFYRRGYEVISVADCPGTLMNFRQAEEATFDHKGKAIFDFDTCFNSILLVKDLPVVIKDYNPMDTFELKERILTMVQDAIETTGRNPKIFLTGSMMQDTELYGSLIDRLEGSGYSVYDLFDRPTVDPETGRDPSTGRTVLTPDYAINIAMLMSAYAKSVVALTPKIGFDEIFKKNSKNVATFGLIAASLVFLFAGFNAGKTLLAMKTMKDRPPQVSQLQSTISNLQAQQTQLQNTINTLTQADVTVLDTLDFIYSNKSPLINIVSVDTKDMLPSANVDTSGTTAGDASTEEGGVHVAKTREAIIIRGYARTDNAAIDFYQKLFNYGLPTDPVLNGVEKYTLPDGTDVHVFEIEIGGYGT